MANVQKQTGTKVPLAKELSYAEVIEFLNQHWNEKRSNLDCVKRLDKELGSPSKSLNTIFIGGTNGKSLTIHFVARLLKEEGLSVGALSDPHILTYNERIALNQETINNKMFAELANEVINAAQAIEIVPHSQEVLTLMSFLHFVGNNVDVAVLEVGSGATFWHAAKICEPKVVGITRVTQQHPTTQSLQETIEKTLELVHKNSWLVCADQSKLNLQVMQDHVVARGGNWAMPIRKLATLAYPFEQLHGRCAALAERVAQIYVNTYFTKDATIVQDSLLVKQKGQRGRPTLEAKRQSELHPKHTILQFWKEIATTLPGRFHILDKEKPTTLLDNASNLDAFQNVLLGIRLLHYQRPLKGLVIIVGADVADLQTSEFAKIVRYFFKKTSGSIILTPVEPLMHGPSGALAPNLEKIANELKNLKVKVKIAINFQDAYESAIKMVDERHGLLAITGSDAVIAQYWDYKGIKKF